MPPNRNKPPELNESQIKDENAKRFVQNVHKLTNKLIYVYQWNIDTSDTAPIGLYVDPTAVELVSSTLEGIGAAKLSLDNGVKFDLTTATGFQGAHFDMYHSGKINVQWQKGGRSKKSPDFANLALFDIIEVIAKTLKEQVSNGDKVNDDSDNEDYEEVKGKTNKAKQNNNKAKQNNSKAKQNNISDENHLKLPHQQP